ncbi:hypothetical protein [Phenylobacterium sp.]|uniref:hypothetical protein n=1 Tax=Phenylobacterium sp. TaxID=1871053 RepID=UPI0035AD9F40
MIRTLLTAAAATALLAGAAYAQDTTAQGAAKDQAPATEPKGDMATPPAAPDTAVNPPAGDAAAMPAPPATTSSTTTSAAASPDATAAGVPASATVTSSTVTNGPVADTPENRAKYTPLSRAGKRTKAAGN